MKAMNLIESWTITATEGTYQVILNQSVRTGNYEVTIGNDKIGVSSYLAQDLNCGETALLIDKLLLWEDRGDGAGGVEPAQLLQVAQEILGKIIIR